MSETATGLLNTILTKKAAAGFAAQNAMEDFKNVPDAIRTHDLFLRRETLYPAELQALKIVFRLFF